jgi:LysM repeat protein
MQKTSHRQCFIVVILLLCFLSLYTQEKSPQTVKINILFTNNTNGVLENCECEGSPLGGLDKRLTLMKRMAPRDSGNVLYLDAGDIISPIGFPAKDRFVLKAYKIIPYDAIGIGDQEFSNGLKFFKADIIGRRLPLVSASLIDASTGKSLVALSIIKNIKGIRFGITSVVSREPFDIRTGEKLIGLKILKERRALKDAVNALRKKSEIIILLSHLGSREDKKIANENPAINIIIGSHSQNLQNAEKVGNSIIAQAGKNTEFVGMLLIEVDVSTKKIVSFEGNIQPVLKDIEGDVDVGPLISKYKQYLASGYKDSCVFSNPVPPEFSIVKNEECKSCHPKQFSNWISGRHSKSYLTLKKREATDRTECLTCHTTGVCRGDGFYTENSTLYFANVGCVECHYVTKGHLDSAETATKTKTITEATCTRCHNLENDPTFEFNKEVMLVNHREEKPAFYIVQRGDCLSKIAKTMLGSGKKWQELYNWNKNILLNPHLVKPGQKLHLSESAM